MSFIAARTRVTFLLVTGILSGPIRFVAQQPSLNPIFGTGPALPIDPVARSPFTLVAITDPGDLKNSFNYDKQAVPPIIHARPGETVRIHYENLMSAHSKEQCIVGLCKNMSNLHFHGLHVSPNAPQDDSITMMAGPGQSLDYQIHIPLDQAPGLYWYHTHPHGESYQQSLDGLSGAIVIEGMDRYVPQVRSMRERVLILRDAIVTSQNATTVKEAALVQLSDDYCDTTKSPSQRLFTVNNVLRPKVAIAPGESQFWRIVNASPDLYADLSVDSEQMQVIALDGMPLAFHDPSRRSQTYSHILVPPAGRVEAIVTGPRAGLQASLRSGCVNTGKAGDRNAAMVLADLDTTSATRLPSHRATIDSTVPVYKRVNPAVLAKLKSGKADYTIIFTEDAHGFYINGQAYSPLGPPMTTVNVGRYVHWRVVNNSPELHPFHIHQVHFLAYKINGKPKVPAEWLDTINVPTGGSVDLIMDFTDPIIRGTSLFHCHLLKHEDKGMMAKILFR